MAICCVLSGDGDRGALLAGTVEELHLDKLSLCTECGEMGCGSELSLRPALLVLRGGACWGVSVREEVLMQRCYPLL